MNKKRRKELSTDDLSRFNKVSRLTCTFGFGIILLLPGLLAPPSKPTGLFLLDAFTNIVVTILAGVLIGVYLLLPYHVYQRSVVQNEEVAWVEELFFLYLWTGIFGGFILVFIFDLFRLGLKAIMKPKRSDEIDFWFFKPKTKSGLTRK